MRVLDGKIRGGFKISSVLGQGAVLAGVGCFRMELPSRRSSRDASGPAAPGSAAAGLLSPQERHETNSGTMSHGRIRFEAQGISPSPTANPRVLPSGSQGYARSPHSPAHLLFPVVDWTISLPSRVAVRRDAGNGLAALPPGVPHFSLYAPTLPFPGGGAARRFVRRSSLEEPPRVDPSLC